MINDVDIEVDRYIKDFTHCYLLHIAYSKINVACKIICSFEYAPNANYKTSNKPPPLE